MDILRLYMRDGGPLMYVILAVSLVGVVLFVERFISLFVLQRLSAAAFVQQVVHHIESRRFSGALEACSLRTRHPLVAVIKAGVLRANRREKEIERAMEKEMLGALPRL